MHESGEYEIKASFEELARLVGCETQNVTRCVTELKRTNTADVTLGNDFVTLLSRRLERELKTRKQTQLRVQRLRGNADVTQVKRDRVISKSKSNKKELREEEEAPTQLSGFQDWDFPLKDLVDSFPHLVDLPAFTPAMCGEIESVVKAGDEQAWTETITLYRRNFDPINGSYRPEKYGTLLDVFKKKKKELERDGTHRLYKKRTDADVIAESSDFYANYPA